MGLGQIFYKMELLIPPCNEQQKKYADFLDKKTAQLDNKALLEANSKTQDYRASLIYEPSEKLDKTVPMKIRESTGSDRYLEDGN